MTIAYITHPDCLLHEIGNHHPERPERLHAIHDQLISSGLEFVLIPHEAPLIETVHLESQMCIRDSGRSVQARAKAGHPDAG